MRLIDADKLMENKFKNDISYNAFCNLVKRQPSIDAVPQWIPCNEMLPDGRLNKSYLVQDKDGRLAVGTYKNWGWMFGHYMNDPVAWMPLPKPYEAERKEE